MLSPKEIRIKDFDYSLPEERIARFPLEERDASKLLIWDNGRIAEDTYRHLPSHLSPPASLVFNNTRVIEARILFRKPTGGQIEIFTLEPDSQYPDITSAMLQHGQVRWKCLIGGASKWKPGTVLEKKMGDITLTASMAGQAPDAYLVDLRWDQDISFAELLHQAGLIPLPPYLKREVAPADAERYQTIYAKEEGSVAAPTAGLHFTDRVFADLAKKGIHTRYVTLHVGAGTFKPVKADTMEGHVMHAEFIDVSADAIQTFINDKNLIAVGTTSLRTLETLYWMGVKLALDPSLTPEEAALQQWDVYDKLQYHALPRREALAHLLTYMHERKMDRLVCRTQLLITPGYTARMVKGIITNFHQPQSTLLLLIAALIGPEWKNLYAYALAHDYRFLSYGDGMLIMFGNLEY